MLDFDLLIVFFMMVVLFIRQMFILKQSNKISYAPVVLSIGFIGGLIHFILDQNASNNFIFLLKESFIPIIVALLLFIILNLIHQTQIAMESKEHFQQVENLTYQFLELKDFVYNLETRIVVSQQDENKKQNFIDEKLRLSLKMLETLQNNQDRFVERFLELERWQKHVSKMLDEFTHIEMPEFDSIVHKHIDLLRVAEQDHFNKLESIIRQDVEIKVEVKEELDELRTKLLSMKTISDDIAKSITHHTLQQLSDVTKEFETQMMVLKTHTEGVQRSLHEDEKTLDIIKNRSEMIMKQMRLSSEKMKELQEQNDLLNNSHNIIRELIQDVEFIKKEYVHSRIQLSSIVDDFKETEIEQIDNMREQIDNLTHLLAQKIEESLTQLREHYHIADNEVAKSVQQLSQKTKLLQGYTEN